tara:strand:+ start:35 stop:403 length:369 start_codon:yes stop_codon:yes gene_type:complete
MDIRSSSIVGGVQLLTDETVAAHVPEDEPLQRSRKELKNNLDRLQRYIIKSARNRVKMVKKGNLSDVLQAIHLEINLSSALGRMDLIENLIERKKEIEHLIHEIEKLEVDDYQKRFGLTQSQ